MRRARGDDPASLLILTGLRWRAKRQTERSPRYHFPKKNVYAQLDCKKTKTKTHGHEPLKKSCHNSKGTLMFLM